MKLSSSGEISFGTNVPWSSSLNLFNFRILIHYTTLRHQFEHTTRKHYKSIFSNLIKIFSIISTNMQCRQLTDLIWLICYKIQVNSVEICIQFTLYTWKKVILWERISVHEIWHFCNMISKRLPELTRMDLALMKI